jgi:hypothetical protein
MKLLVLDNLNCAIMRLMLVLVDESNILRKTIMTDVLENLF